MIGTAAIRQFSNAHEPGFSKNIVDIDIAVGTASFQSTMSTEKHQELRARTKAFALRIIRMSQALPRTRESNALAQQILRSATGMAANYRAAGRSRSKAEFIAKIGVVLEEADETVFWLEMLSDSNIFEAAKLRNLLSEADQLVAIFTASRKTARE